MEDSDNNVSDHQPFSGSEVFRQSKEKESDDSGDQMTMDSNHEIDDDNLDGSSIHLQTDETTSEDDEKLTYDAVVSNPPRIMIINNAIPIQDTPSQETSRSKIPRYNKRALSKHAATYEMEKFEKNALIIFNQVTIDGYSKPRYGTEKDVDALTNTFANFGFEVKEHTDLTIEGIFAKLREFIMDTDYTDYGCIGVVILTHGSDKGQIRAKDDKYNEADVINYLKIQKNATLVTKPKFLFIQACRGTKTPVGVSVHEEGKIQKDIAEETEPYVLPVEADMLILHSSYVGNPSIRDVKLGSWFIQSLCRKINQLSDTHDLESIIIDMKREVAIDREHAEYNISTNEVEINKQMPVVTSTLIRKLHLKSFMDEPLVSMTPARVDESSRNQVLDSGSSISSQVPVNSCMCFLDHFNYIKDCLRYYLKENSGDVTAQSFLNVANTFEEAKHDASKEKMAEAICKYLTANAKQYEFYKFIYFYKH